MNIFSYKLAECDYDVYPGQDYLKNRNATILVP